MVPTASYERGAAQAAAAVVAVGVAARQVGRSHQGVALVAAAVLRQDVHALLAAGLPRVRHGAVPVGVPRHQVRAVLRRQRRVRTRSLPLTLPTGTDQKERSLPRPGAAAGPRCPCGWPGAARCSRRRRSR